MGRQVLMVFFGKARTKAAAKASESPAVITVPLIVLAVLSALWWAAQLALACIAWNTGWNTVFDGAGRVRFQLAGGRWFAGSGAAGSVHGLAGVRPAQPWARRESPDPLAARLGGVFRGMENKWWVDEAYHAIIVRPYRMADALPGRSGGSGRD